VTDPNPNFKDLNKQIGYGRARAPLTFKKGGYSDLTTPDHRLLYISEIHEAGAVLISAAKIIWLIL
jgi:hypothetical protein